MDVLDLFSGIGGFSLGLERAGMRTVAFCEIDPFCQRVIAKHWPLAEIHGDVTKRGFVRGEADVITAGFPCQDISLAGEGAGLAGERSGLYRHVIRAIRLVRPKFAVLENVAALLGRGLDQVVGDLAEIGYDSEWHCIPACSVGAPHRRDRIWIVAYPANEQWRIPGQSRIDEGMGSVDADPSGERLQGLGSWREAGREDGAQQRGETGGVLTSTPITDAICREFAQRGQIRRMGRQESISWDRAWEVASEPFIRRGDHGFSNRSHRLRALGNAVVPKIPEIIGRAIMSTKREL